NAKTSFYLEVYTLSSEPLVNELIRAHQRDVEVIVLLSHDRVSSYEDEYTEEAAYRLNNTGIDVLWTSSTFRFTHAKFWIVDHELVFVYSGNWAPSSIPQYSSARNNREMGFAFDDTDIAAYYETVFFDDYLIASPYDSSIGHTGNLQANATSGTYKHPFTSSTFVEYAEVTPIFSPDNSYELLSVLIKSANETIDLELQYILFDCDLLDDIIDAAQRGVRVRVIIPEPDSTNDNVTETLLTNGIQVKFFEGLGHNHNKYVCVDGEIVQISSINWSNNSLTNNREAGAIVKNANVADYFTAVFEYDWDRGELPTGFVEPLSIVAPKPGGRVDSTYTFKVSFSIYNYTKGELLIDSTSVQEWTDPEGLVTQTIDMSSYSQGIHDIKAIGTTDTGDSIEVETKFNVIHTTDWLLLISEVRYDAVSEPNGEFVELYNGFTFDLYIERWILTDNEDEYKIPEGTEIKAGKILIFAHDSATFISEMSDLGITGVSADYGLGDLYLANTGDEVILLDPEETMVDAVAWGSGSVTGVVSWSGSSSEEETLQRVPANQDTDDCSVDFESKAPTPGTVEVDTNTGSEPSETPTGDISYGTISFLILSISLYSLIAYAFKRRRN
ncbi:MAG: phospholipase D-like domain-containing protein, partial [Candidatus Heimdallarchaeaceae archaeon]